MNKEVKDFLESGLLDKYVIGDTSPSENFKVETYLEQYPEIKEAYDILQDELEISALADAIKAPTHVLDSVLDSITPAAPKETPVIAMHPPRKTTPWMRIAATAAAVLFAGTSLVFYTQNKSLKEENNTIADEIFDLRDDIDSNNEKLDEVVKALNKLNNPETQKYVLRGNERAKDLKTVAYINPIEKSSLIDVVSLPELSDEQYYKMWAQVNDKMIDLGILDTNNRKLQSVPYIEDALSLSITIENKNGSKTSTNEKEVAQIELEKEN